jgi:hypothetical protein
MRCLRNLSTILLSCLVVSACEGQDIPSITTAAVGVSVVAANGILRYNYSLGNPTLNTAAIGSFRLDVSTPKNGGALSGADLDSGPGFLSANSAAIMSEPTASQMVPFGCYVPANWIATATVDGELLWGAEDDTSTIQPGTQLGGFQITTYGIPSIRQFRIEPALDFDSLPLSEPTPETLASYATQFSTLLNTVSYSAKTVGPTAPPANFDPVTFMQTIQSYKEQAFQQGWIDNSGIANSLDVKLNVALNSLQAHDNNTAKNVLNAFLNEVQAQSGKHLSTEAVALLEFNAQYLLSKLP